MLDMARPGDVIVVWRLDRLGRSLKQLIETVTHLNERGIELKSIKENIDMTTPTGKLMFHIIGAMAEFERDVIRERTTAGLEAARARGRKGGRPKATETIKPRNLALAKALYAEKEKSIAEIMEQTGFKSRATFYKYVVNRPNSVILTKKYDVHITRIEAVYKLALQALIQIMKTIGFW